jgi:hypothetical protein
MRLSFGQELRMVQKQVLAPRMIQSMEILQLPILALQERIEQEMEENPVLEIPEEELETAAETGEEPVDREVPDAPSEEERELVIDEAHSNEGDFERLLQMDEQWPDHFEERSRCKISSTINSAVSIWSRKSAHFATGSLPISIPTATCKAVWKICWEPTPRRMTLRWPNGRWLWCRSSTRRASPPAICANACFCNSRRA